MAEEKNTEEKSEYIDEFSSFELPKSEEHEPTKEELKLQKQQEKQKALMKKKRFKDRREGRYIRSIDAVQKIMPFIMPERSDATNSFTASIDVSKADKYCREKVKSGEKYFTILHLILAAYVRTVAEHPEINRFVSGQRIYARRNIEVNMVVKKEMTLASPETGIKVWFDPSDTADQVYEKFNDKVQEVVGKPDSVSDMDKANKLLLMIPRGLLRFTFSLLRWLDYHGWMPKSLLKASPFHGSLIITSMGSLGIPPIYHHIYNFGNLPIFVSYGIKQIIPAINKDGETVPKKIVELKVVTDERICNGFSFASAFKAMKYYIEHPDLLDTPPETVKEDLY